MYAYKRDSQNGGLLGGPSYKGSAVFGLAKRDPDLANYPARRSSAASSTSLVAPASA